MDKVKLVYFGSKHYHWFEQLLQKINKHWSICQVNDNTFDDKVFDDEAHVILIYETPDSLKSDFYKNENGRFYGILTILDENQPSEDFDELVDYVSVPLVEWQVLKSLQQLVMMLSAKEQIGSLNEKLNLKTQELAVLNHIGIALSAERDPEALLELILTKAREITYADAGSLYLVEKNPDIQADENDFWKDKQLRFKLAQNDSIQSSYREFVMPVKKESMAGFTALTGRVLNISDAYNLPDNSEVRHNRSFDEKMGYRTRAVLCIPMKSHQGDLIGVLQLINRKVGSKKVKLTFDNVAMRVVPFDERCEELASSLASQAAISIENMRLYEEIKKLFEGFIVASVHAIEQRDPTTSGHSERVAQLTVGLAKQIDRLDSGPFRNVNFSRDDIQQINYASLLHDFGKIGVRESVLVKAKKLYPEQLEMVKNRFKLIKKVIELDLTKEKLDNLNHSKNNNKILQLPQIDEKLTKRLKEIDQYVDFILQANEPRVLAEGGFEQLNEISKIVFEDDNELQHYLSEHEAYMLSIPRGSLSEEERREIESHVTHTYNFLSRIPWASHLKKVPHYAHAHHEKLDGTGYPRKLSSAEIPFPSKMMAISDIFDALTASDRPYKRAVPPDKALDILMSESRAGKIDSEILRLFIDAKIYELVL